MKHRPRILGTINLAKTLKSKARVPVFQHLAAIGRVEVFHFFNIPVANDAFHPYPKA